MISKRFGQIAKFCGLAFSISALSCLSPSTASASRVTSVLTSELLTDLLVQRCLHHGGVFQRSSWKCARAAHLMVKDLDTDFHFDRSGLKDSASFRSELQELLRSPAVLKYLDETSAFIDSHLAEVGVENLWSWTLNFTNGNADKALQWIAVLFQDSDASAHVNYFGAGVPAVLAVVNEKLRDTEVFRLYPNSLSISVRSQYHFYVIAYLARKLSRRTTSHGLAFILPFVFNATYEYQRYVRMSNSLKGFDAMTQADMLQDTYLGYAGALWALGRGSELIDFQQFSRDFSANPERWISRLFEFY